MLLNKKRFLAKAGLTAAFALCACQGAFAQDSSAGFDDEFYIFGGIGGAFLAEDTGHWRAGDGDPRITFDIDSDSGFAWGFGVGQEVRKGVRVDLAVTGLFGLDANANWVSPPPEEPRTRHADMDADVSSLTLMPNITVEPLTLADIEWPVQPFLTAGAGLAINRMNDWTRINPDAEGPTVRTFDGDTSYEFAWTVGAGLTADVFEIDEGPVSVDLTYRYLDAGNVSGSSTPLPDQGRGIPNEPFNFDLITHVVMVALRVPLN